MLESVVMRIYKKCIEDSNDFINMNCFIRLVQLLFQKCVKVDQKTQSYSVFSIA